MRVVLLCTAILIAALLFVSAVSAATLYVDRSAPGPTHDGLSWGTAFLKIGDAAAASQSTGGDIWVAMGTYTQNLNITTKARAVALRRRGCSAGSALD